ncbi:MAG: Trk system potassium transporter TrkA [Spirochaetes bacterium]|nr:Trk system potassium transporter TrkA [Spirochaetota bacterium]MBU0956822.1 Trk system potassium transporter TrkA [Spirochaetota bacterium]
MKVVIVGAGKLGQYIARRLIEEKRDVILIEKDQDTANAAGNELDCMVVHDDGSRPEALRKAGVLKADWFLALTGSDEVNIVACGLVAAESRTIRTVARVETPFYASLSAAQRQAFGLDVLIDPARETAQAVHTIISEGFSGDVIPLHGGRLQLRFMENLEGSAFVDRSLMELRSAYSQRFLVAAVVRAGSLVIPDGNFLLTAKDQLYILGAAEDLNDLLGSAEAAKHEAKRILIIGATSITERLIETLHTREHVKGFGQFIKKFLRSKRSITVVDDDVHGLKQFARAYQGVECISGDCTEEKILESIHVDKADLVLCATDSQTRNILLARLAKSLGAAKTVAVLTNDRFKQLSADLDIDALVSMKSVVAAAVLELIRHARIRTIHEFFQDDIEIVELALTETSPSVGKTIIGLNLPKGILVAFIINAKEVRIPDGNTVLQAGDTLAFIVLNKDISGLERVFGDLGHRLPRGKNGN